MTEVIVSVIGALAACAAATITAILGRPIRETHKQVSQNSHKNSPPTILDELADVKGEIRTLNNLVVSHINWHLESEK